MAVFLLGICLENIHNLPVRILRETVNLKCFLLKCSLSGNGIFLPIRCPLEIVVVMSGR